MSENVAPAAATVAPSSDFEAGLQTHEAVQSEATRSKPYATHPTLIEVSDSEDVKPAIFSLYFD